MPPHMESVAAWFERVPGTTPFVRTGARSTWANSRSISAAASGGNPQRLRDSLIGPRWIDATEAAWDIRGAVRAQVAIIVGFLGEDGGREGRYWAIAAELAQAWMRVGITAPFVPLQRRPRPAARNV
jgi:hypothetical protein